jgi:peptide/nickel transport system substrate-binding protein
MGVVGTFDSLNPFVLKSMRTTARGLFGDLDFGNLLYETLMQRSRDEPFTLYGLLAEKVAIDPERKWVEFTLNPKPNGPTVSRSLWMMSSSPMRF